MPAFVELEELPVIKIFDSLPRKIYPVMKKSFVTSEVEDGAPGYRISHFWYHDM